MEWRTDVDGWICSRRTETMMHKKLGLCEQMENVRLEAELRDGADGFDGVWVGREVVQVLCKSFFQLNG